jgi:hypothetical protein
MADMELYVLAIPDPSQGRQQAQAQRRLAALGQLNSSSGSVRGISTDPGDQAIEGMYRGDYAEKMATELRELANNDALGAIPFTGASTTTPRDSYYHVESADVGPVEPQEPRIQEFRLTLKDSGSRKGRFRSVATSLSQIDMPWGNSLTAYVALPIEAARVRWYDPETGNTESATVQATHNAELGDVDVYDARASSYTDPTLIADLPYDAEGPVDPRVWDTRGNANKLDGNGVLQWQKVFDPAHVPIGDLVIDNGLVRLMFDESANTLTAERWDDAAGQWTSQSLGSSDWEVVDLDLRRIGLERVDGRVEFRDPTQPPTSYYTVGLSLKRGYEDAQWRKLSSVSSAIPSGLDTLLDPVADASVYDAGGDQGLLDRSEVN